MDPKKPSLNLTIPAIVEAERNTKNVVADTWKVSWQQVPIFSEAMRYMDPNSNS